MKGNLWIIWLLLLFLFPFVSGNALTVFYFFGLLVLLRGAGALFWMLILRVANSTLMEKDYRYAGYSIMADVGTGLLVAGSLIISLFSVLYGWGDDGSAVPRTLMKSEWGIKIRFLLSSGALLSMPVVLVRYIERNAPGTGVLANRPRSRMKGICGVLLVIFFLAMVLLSLDAVLSLGVTEGGSLWPVHFIVVSALLGLSGLIIDGLIFRQKERKVLNDWGNLLLAFVLLHAYTLYSSYMIDWFGGMREGGRETGSPAAWLLIIGVLSFLMPLLFLLFKKVKRNVNTLRAVALVIMAGILCEILFWVMSLPSAIPPGDLINVPTVSAFVLGTVFLGVLRIKWKGECNNEIN